MRLLESLTLVAVNLSLISFAQAEVTYPQVALGGGYETVITVTNPTDESWTGQLSFRKGTGAEFPLAIRVNGQPAGPTSQWTLGPHNTARYLVTTEGEATPGYLQITTQSGPPENELVTAVFFRLRDSTGSTVDLVGSYAVEPGRKAIFPIDRGTTTDTGIAFLASSTTAESVLFMLKDASGMKIQEVRLTPSGQVAMMASEIFDQLPKTFLGSITVESNDPLHLLVLRLEISQGVVQLTGTVPLALPFPRSEVTRLTFDPIALEYSNALDRIVAITSNSNCLWIYDPASKQTEQITLGASPTDLSVSPNGLFAAIAHRNGSISCVDLQRRIVEKVLPESTPFSEMVAGGNGFLYLFNTQDRKVVSMRVSDGQQTISDFYLSPQSPFARLHPQEKCLYVADLNYGSGIQKLEVQEGIARYAYPAPHSVYETQSSRFEISEDGQRIFTNGGNVLRASEVRSADMTINGRMPGFLAHFCHSRETGRIAVIPWLASSAEPVGTEVWIYDYATLERRAAVSLPLFPADTTVASRGRYVFYNSSGTRLLVVLEANPGAGLTTGRHGVVVYDVSELELE